MTAQLRPAWRWRFGLTARIAATLGVVAILPLAVALLPTIGANRDALVDQVLRTHLVATRATTARITAVLDERRGLARALAANPLLIDDPTGFEAQELLRATLASDARLLRISVYDTLGAEVVRAQRRGAETATNNPAIGVVSLTTRPDGPVLTLAHPLPAPLGRITLASQVPELAAVLTPEDLGREAALVLLDADGAPLIGEDAAGYPPELDAPAARRVRGATRWWLGENLIVAAWEPVPGTDWLVVSTQPARVAESIALTARRQTVVATSLGLLLAVTSAALAHRAIVRPVRRVLGAQRHLAGRRATERDGDELHQLRNSLEALTRWSDERRQLGSVFVGRYEVQELLGEGAMGAVWRAWDPRLRRAVAIKTIRLEGSDPAKRREALERLAAEAAAAAQVLHPNLVAVYDLEEAPDAAFVAMELVEGQSLDRMLDHSGRRDWRETLHIGAAIARGLAAAHERGLVHRDIKPGNVLVGADGAVKVADFGLAGLVGAGAPTADGKVYGTPGYTPPEVLLGDPATPHADIFALGALLWETLAGHHPFRARTVAKTLRATIELIPQGLATLRPDVPADAIALIESCLAKDPRHRPASAAEIADRLERLAGPKPASV